MENLSANISFIEKDILDTTANLVLQQVNCIGVMGRGLARQIRADLSEESYNYYRTLCLTHGKALLGGFLSLPSKTVPNRIYLNIFSQNTIGTDTRQTRYDKLEQAFTDIDNSYQNERIAIPYKIACGLGGGDWNIVLGLIKKCFKKNLVEIYRLPSKSDFTHHEIKSDLNKGGIVMNNKVLYCDSRGDKRFSALYAKVILDSVEDTIENFYQNSKRDENNKVPGKGRKVSYMIFRGKKLPASKLSDFYRYLWKLYFRQNPKLLEYASQFDTFIDRFRGRCINCQADVIRDLVNEYRNTEPTSTKSEPNVGSLRSRKGDKCMEKLDLSSLEVGKEPKIHILDLLNQEEEREEAYFLKEEEKSRNANSFELYITQDPRKGFLDITLFTNLYNFCIKAIKSRLVMILDLEKVISSLVNIEEYTYGFKENPTVTQAESLKTFYGDIKAKLSDKKVKEFIKVNNDYTVFGCDDATRCDYITTYQKVIRLLTKTCGESLEFYKDVINNVKDELQSIILDNTYEVETISLVENEESEDSLEYAY